jgi:hypothetical protein
MLLNLIFLTLLLVMIHHDMYMACVCQPERDIVLSIEGLLRNMCILSNFFEHMYEEHHIIKILRK